MYEDEHKAELLKFIMNAGSRYDVWRVFSDFCEMLADTISNSVDWPQRITMFCDGDLRTIHDVHESSKCWSLFDFIELYEKCMEA